MSKIKKVVLVLVVSVIALLWLVGEYPSFRFHGDGIFTGGPILGYKIVMRPISFSQAGQYVFHFRGLPDEELSLLLYAEGKTDQNREELTHLETTLDALLVDQDGHTICQASGLPRDGQNENIWVVESSAFDAAFWHWNCVHMPLKSSDTYTLTLPIGKVDPNTPKIRLLPVLEGGKPDLT